MNQMNQINQIKEVDQGWLPEPSSALTNDISRMFFSGLPSGNNQKYQNHPTPLQTMKHRQTKRQRHIWHVESLSVPRCSLPNRRIGAWRWRFGCWRLSVPRVPLVNGEMLRGKHRRKKQFFFWRQKNRCLATSHLLSVLVGLGFHLSTIPIHIKQDAGI